MIIDDVSNTNFDIFNNGKNYLFEHCVWCIMTIWEQKTNVKFA